MSTSQTKNLQGLLRKKQESTAFHVAESKHVFKSIIFLLRQSGIFSSCNLKVLEDIWINSKDPAQIALEMSCEPVLIVEIFKNMRDNAFKYFDSLTQQELRFVA